MEVLQERLNESTECESSPLKVAPWPRNSYTVFPRTVRTGIIGLLTSLVLHYYYYEQLCLGDWVPNVPWVFQHSKLGYQHQRRVAFTLFQTPSQY